MSFELAGFPLSGVDHLCPDEQEQVAVVLAENGEQFDIAGIYASKDELIVFNNTVAENPISGRHLTRMWGLQTVCITISP